MEHEDGIGETYTESVNATFQFLGCMFNFLEFFFLYFITHTSIINVLLNVSHDKLYEIIEKRSYRICDQINQGLNLALPLVGYVGLDA